MTDKGDMILADRGFNIDDLCTEKEVSLVIPPFRQGKEAFSNEELLKTKLIARARVHVERFNERIKNFKLLQGVIPLNLMPLFSQIVYITCCLVLFQEPLVK
jgi:hypothetical protein